MINDAGPVTASYTIADHPPFSSQTTDNSDKEYTMVTHYVCMRGVGALHKRKIDIINYVYNTYVEYLLKSHMFHFIN